MVNSVPGASCVVSLVCRFISLISKISPISKRLPLSPKAAMFIAVKSEVVVMFLTWFLSLYLTMVLPGVRSMGSPAAALDTWNSICEITPDVPVVLEVRITAPFCSRVPRGLS